MVLLTVRLKVGVVGCGLIAQVMHLHFLRELREQFEIVALCDTSEDVRSACARDYGVDRTFADWRDLIACDIDAVFVLTSGSHAPIAIAAAEAGRHLFIEKPLCFSVLEGKEIIAGAERAGVVMLVGYNKRYDPAYRRLQEETKGLRDLRLVRVITLESPFQPYVAHYRLHKSAPPPAVIAARFNADNEARIAAAIGDVDALSRRAYHLVLLDSMVHEFNAIRGILGEPDRLEFADISENGLTTVLRFGETQCIISWVDLPGMARYLMEFAFYALDRRLTLSFPSPFLRSAPTLLTIEAGNAEAARAWAIAETTSYTESFKEELIHFHDCVCTGRQPITSANDALRDIALCQAVIGAHRDRMPRNNPTAI